MGVWTAAEQRATLEARFGALSESKDDVSDRLDKLVWLIGWLHEHPECSESEWRDELKRTTDRGPAREPLTFGARADTI